MRLQDGLPSIGSKPVAEGLDEALVAAVDIATKRNGSGPVRPRRDIDDMNRDRLGKIDHPLFPTGDLGIDFLARPALVLEQQRRQIEGILDPHAAMAEHPEIPGEKILGRGIVEIDIEAVGKHELRPAKRVLGAGILTQAIGYSRQFRPIYAIGTDLPRIAATAAEYANGLALQRPRVLLELRQIFVVSDR